ncbi:MAG: glycosyltransferase [Actinomycetota bacterium]
MSPSGPKYREFIEETAGDLVALRQSLMSSFTGWRFRKLCPEMFRKVREGSETFGKPTQTVYGDLTAACAERRSGFVRLGRFWFGLVAEYLRPALRLSWQSYVVLPLAWRKIKGPVPQPPADNRATSNPVPLASVVMVSYNRLTYLQNALFAFWATVGEADCELIIVDNGSDDGSREFLESAHRRGWISKLLLLEQNMGNSAGYNHGFALAHPDSRFLMKLDSDIKILTHDWLNRAIEFLQGHPDTGFVSLNQLNVGTMRILPRHNLDGFVVMDFAEWTLGSAMIVPRQIFDRIGQFVERADMLYLPDDVDYYARVARAGFKTFHLADLKVFHQNELDLTRYWKYSRAKRTTVSLQLALSMAKDYDRGDRPLDLFWSTTGPGGSTGLFERT